LKTLLDEVRLGDDVAKRSPARPSDLMSESADHDLLVRATQVKGVEIGKVHVCFIDEAARNGSR